MRIALRLAVAWLLMISLPLQGFAAAALSACAQDHRHAATAAGADAGHRHHAQAGDAGHRHDAGREAYRHLHADRPHAVPDVIPAVAAAVAIDGAATDAGCIACTACCTGTALPAGAGDAVAESVAAAPEARRPIVRAMFLTDGPERPPRRAQH